MTYTYGKFHRIGKSQSKGNADHILLIDHRYGPHLMLAYGDTLCGRRGRVSNVMDFTWGEIVSDLIASRSLCGTCKKVMRGR